MKYVLIFIFIASLLFVPLNQAAAQSNTTTTTTDMSYKSSDLPQWVKDMRRFDIIAFGVFPFSMFFVTFITDTIRWIGTDINDFRYAPWPLKSAGAVEMTQEEHNRTILIAAGVSVVIALVDLAIVLVRRNSEKRRAESLPSGSYTIETSPYGTEPENENADNENKPETVE